MAAPTSFAPAPVRTPRVGGLSSVVGPYRDNPRLGVGGRVQFDPEQCGVTFGAVALCYNEGDPAQEEKTGAGIGAGLSISDNFGGYTGVQCYLNGEIETYGPMARAQLEAGQDRFLESRLFAWFSTGPQSTVTSLADAIANADAQADIEYIGRPIMHLNRGDAVRAVGEGLLVTGSSGSGEIWTPNGTPVVSSARYESNAVAVSGAVAVEQSGIRVFEGLNITENTMLAIAERVYALLVDCEYRYTYFVEPTP